MSSEPETALRVEGLSKCYQLYARPQDRLKQALFRGKRTFYKEFWALRDISLQVAKGTTLGIIGRNGSGKSTLLQLICGTLSPSTGSIHTQGRVAALLELGAGFHPDFTGRENVYANARLHGLTTAETDARFNAIEEFADIGEFINRPVKTYSSGMYVRLAFAVIANVDADILVIDEALAVGDVFFTQKCMRFLRRFREHGTIIFVSHDTAAVLALCHDALWLDEGRACASGSAKDVVERYLAAFHEDSRTRNSASRTPTEEGRSEPSQIEATTLGPPTFNPVAQSFGSMGATITHVSLTDHTGAALQQVRGGELATLTVIARANISITRALVGFFLRDRLGQDLFGENTHQKYAHTAISVAAGKCFSAIFQFRMPVLRAGDYTISVAVTEGTQEEHTILHWIHDALAIKSLTPSYSTGLVGIPMSSIVLSSL